MWTSGTVVITIVLILHVPVISGQHDSNFSIPMFFPYGNCSTVNKTETLTLFYTHILEGKRLLYGYPILGPSHGKDELFPSTIDVVHIFQLVREDTDEDSHRWSNYCENAAIGYFTSVQSDPTASLTVSMRGDNSVQLFSSLPFEPRKDTEANQTTQLYEYYLLFGSFTNNDEMDAFAITVGSQFNYDPTNVTIVSSIDLMAVRNSMDSVMITAFFDEVSLEIDEVLWLSGDCNVSNGNLSGTWIRATKPVGIFTANSQCSNESSNFHLNHQMPPVHRWGKTFIVDLLPLKPVQSANITISFTMLAKNNSNVVIRWYSKERQAPTTSEYILQAEYPLTVTRDPIAFTGASIQASDPILAIYEVYSTKEYFSILLQPVTWFSNQQSLVLSQPLIHHNLQQFVISIVMETKYFNPHNIIVTDASQPELSATTLAQYKYFTSQDTDWIDGYAVFHLELSSDSLPEEEVLLLVNHTNPCANLGATVYSYGNETSFAYSNGFVLDNSLSGTSTQCSTYLANDDDTFSAYTVIVGATVGMLAFAVVLAVIILMIRIKGRNKLVSHPEKEPDNDYEFDAFLSFAEKDREFVEGHLYFPLTNRGYRIFWHYKHFIPGHTIDDNIIRAVRISRRVIFVCTIHFQESAFCQKELEYAVASHYSEGRRRIIPVILQEDFCPKEFRQLNQVRLPCCHGDIKRDLIQRLELGQPVNVHKKKTGWRKNSNMFQSVV